MDRLTEGGLGGYPVPSLLAKSPKAVEKRESRSLQVRWRYYATRCARSGMAANGGAMRRPSQSPPSTAPIVESIMPWIAVRVGLASSREGGEWSSETFSWGGEARLFLRDHRHPPTPRSPPILRRVGLKLCNPASRRRTRYELPHFPTRLTSFLRRSVTSFFIWGLLITVCLCSNQFPPSLAFREPGSRGAGARIPLPRTMITDYNLASLPTLSFSSKRFRKATSTSSVKSLAWRLRPRLAKARRELS